MITMVTRNVVDKLWPVIDPAIEEALPPYADKDSTAMNNVREEIVKGGVQVWLVTDIGEDNRPVLYATLLTMMATDTITGTKNLELYAMYGYNEMDMRTWLDVKRTLVEYAKMEGCRRLVAFTNNEAVVGMVGKLGGAVEYKYLVLEVDHE